MKGKVSNCNFVVTDNEKRKVKESEESAEHYCHISNGKRRIPLVEGWFPIVLFSFSLVSFIKTPATKHQQIG